MYCLHTVPGVVRLVLWSEWRIASQGCPILIYPLLHRTIHSWQQLSMDCIVWTAGCRRKQAITLTSHESHIPCTPLHSDNYNHSHIHQPHTRTSDALHTPHTHPSLPIHSTSRFTFYPRSVPIVAPSLLLLLFVVCCASSTFSCPPDVWSDSQRGPRGPSSRSVQPTQQTNHCFPPCAWSVEQTTRCSQRLKHHNGVLASLLHGRHTSLRTSPHLTSLLSVVHHCGLTSLLFAPVVGPPAALVCCQCAVALLTLPPLRPTYRPLLPPLPALRCLVATMRTWTRLTTTLSRAVHS